MVFDIENGVPYLVTGGRAYPVKIKDGSVEYDASDGTMTESKGRYSLAEVMAKCGREVSSLPKKSRKKAGEN